MKVNERTLYRMMSLLQVAKPVIIANLMFALLLVGCDVGKAPRLTGRQLHLFAFSAYIPPALIKGFEKATGVNVELETYGSNQEMLRRLKNRPGHYDLIIPSDYMVETLIAEKALRPLDLGRIPGWTNIESRFQSPYFDPGGATRGRLPTLESNAKYSVPYLWGTTGIAYDRTKVNPPLTRWSDLWRPELSGHLVVVDDSREMMGLTLLTLGFNKNESSLPHLEQARAKLVTLMKGVVAIDSACPESYLISGQAWAGVVYNGNAVLAGRQNPNIVYLFPEEGAGIWFDNMAIPADAPHVDAAYAFIDWMLRPENSVLLTREFPYSNPNEAALDWLKARDPAAYAAYQGSPASNPSPEALAGAKLVKRVVSEAGQAYEQAWSAARNAQKERP